MGKQKYLKKIESLFEKSPMVNFSSIARIVRYKKNTQYTKQLVKNLISKGKIKRLTKGCYTKYDEVSLSVFCFKPAYFGLQDALSFYNLWEQEAIPIIVTTKKVRPGIRKILGLNVLIKRINTKYFFGFEYKKIGDFYFPYSNIEKTFIDMVYFNEQLSKEAMKNIRRRIDKKRLSSYLKNYSKKFRKRVLNYLENPAS